MSRRRARTRKARAGQAGADAAAAEAALSASGFAAAYPAVDIESLDQDGRGVARSAEGKTVFVEGGLPGERVRIAVFKRRPTYEFADAVRVERAAPTRVAPRCPHFGTCGGCAMQHLEPRAQVAAKQRVLEDDLWHIAKVRPGQMLSAIHGPTWGYRYRARLSVRNVAKKGGVLVGFHEKRSSFVAVMQECHVLPAAMSALLLPLRALVEALTIRDRMPQIEVAVTDPDPAERAAGRGRPHCALVFRILEPLTAADEALLREFADRHAVQVFLQPKGPETALPFHPAAPALLEYTLPEHGVRLRFAPTEFTQVNAGVNEMLVRRAIGLLAPRPGERIADFFCGLGNFSLPIAAAGAEVHGVEGAKALVERAGQNAALNGLARRSTFSVADLFQADAASLAALGHFDKWLIDPPRDGAIALVKALPRRSDAGSTDRAGLAAVPDGAASTSTQAPSTPVAAPSRIVYVSCNPATLARDASVLVHEKGYRLRAAGIANMFPHTAHVESIACFERDPA